MRATVIKFLNIRTGSPRILPNNNPEDLFFRPGDIIDIAETVKGDEYKHIDVWYRLQEGNFVWSGGVSQPENEPLKFNSYSAKLTTLINWNQKIRQLPMEWVSSKGRGVKVAVLDSGIFKQHEDFANSIAIYEDLTKINDRIDYTGHGTHVAGIIGSRSKTTNGLIGVAPECEVMVIKVIFDVNDGSPENFKHIVDALEIAKGHGVDLINLSFKLNLNAAEEEAIRKKIKELTDAGITIVAAGGDNADMQLGKLFFPANCDGVISAAAIDEGYFDVFPTVPPQLNFIGPSINYMSTFKEPIFYQGQSGCSMITAFISGILALAMSSIRKNDPNKKFSKTELVNLLHQHSIPLNQISYSNGDVFSYHSFKLLS